VSGARVSSVGSRIPLRFSPIRVINGVVVSPTNRKAATSFGPISFRKIPQLEARFLLKKARLGAIYLLAESTLKVMTCKLAPGSPEQFSF